LRKISFTEFRKINIYSWYFSWMGIVVLNRQVAAEAKLMAEMYRGLTRQAQIAMLANMEGMARNFPDHDRTVETGQPLPGRSPTRTVAEPPGLPQRSAVLNKIWSSAPRNALLRNNFEEYAGSLYSDLARHGHRHYEPDAFILTKEKYTAIELKRFSSN
jgi:hypothetical protein